MITRRQTARNTEVAEILSPEEQMESENGGSVSIDDSRSSRGSETGSENRRKDEEREETILQHSNANEGKTEAGYQLLETNDLLEKILKGPTNFKRFSRRADDDKQ